MVANKTDDVGIVEIVVLKEGDSGLSALHSFAFVHNLHFVSYATAFHIFANHSVGTKVEGESHYKTHDDLPYNFPLSCQSVFVLLEYLDIIV